MRIGLGHLGLAPREFWGMSLVEFMQASEGYLERKGVRKRAGEFPTQAEVDELMTAVDDQGNLIR